MNIPSEITAGDSRVWRDDPITFDGTDYTSAWTLSYRLRGPSTLDLTATAAGVGWSTAVTAAQTDALVPGTYRWIASLSLGIERITVDIGTLILAANPTEVMAPFEARSHARKVLDAIEAVIESRATRDQEAYEIAGRSLKRTPIPDLLALRDRYRAEATREEAADGVDTSRYFVRFGRV